MAADHPSGTEIGDEDEGDTDDLVTHVRTLFCRLAECIDSDAVDETVDRCLDEV